MSEPTIQAYVIKPDGRKFKLGSDLFSATPPSAPGDIPVWDGSKWVTITAEVHAGAGLLPGLTAGAVDVGTFPGSGVLVNADDIAIDRSVTDDWYPALPPTTPTSPEDGDSIIWDPSAGDPPGTGGWVYGPGGATTLDALWDVDTTTVVPLDEQTIVWSSTAVDTDLRSGQWIPAGPHLKLVGGTMVPPPDHPSTPDIGIGIDTSGAPVSNVRYNPAGVVDTTGAVGPVVQPHYAASIQYVDDLITLITDPPQDGQYLPERDGLLLFVVSTTPPPIDLEGFAANATVNTLTWTEPQT